MEYWLSYSVYKARCEKAAPTPSCTAPWAPHTLTCTQERPAGFATMHGEWAVSDHFWFLSWLESQSRPS